MQGLNITFYISTLCIIMLYNFNLSIGTGQRTTAVSWKIWWLIYNHGWSYGRRMMIFLINRRSTSNENGPTMTIDEEVQTMKKRYHYFYYNTILLYYIFHKRVSSLFTRLESVTTTITCHCVLDKCS